jgi:NADPH2:quinone reductase
MKAMVCRQLGAPEVLRVEDVETPEPRANQVRVRVQACSINFPDLLMIAGRYQERPELPFIPGGEVAGIVDAVGAEVRDFELGASVMAVSYTGGLAECVTVDRGGVFEIPAGMSPTVAAGFPGVYGTSYYALKHRAALRAGENLLVLGASGGVGLAAVQIGGAMGARVIAAAGHESKVEFLRQHGADEVINYGTSDLRDSVKALTGGAGADVIYDPVGGDLFDKATRCINWNGRILVVGFASGRIPEFPVNLALLKGMSVVGVFYGRFFRQQHREARQNMRELAAMYAEGRLRPHVHKTFPLADTAAAMACVGGRTVVGKVIVEIES